jgi:hypothetical protein
MSDDTPRLRLGQMADAQELDAMAINDALIQLDAFTDIALLGQFVNTPPSSPADGDMYLLGASPTGAWSGQAYKLAYCIDGGWRFYAPFNGLRAYVAGSHGFLVYVNGSWIDANALISANLVSLASAATCDLGAAASLFVVVTGSTAITSLGTGANLLRFVRFAGALTLAHNATALVLPGGANITTAAGDSAIFCSDGSGNWRCLAYQQAASAPGSPSFAGLSVTGAATFTGAISANAATANSLLANGKTTAADYWAIVNSGGFTLMGTEGAAGGALATGSSAYASVLLSNGAHPLQLGANGAVAATVNADGSFVINTTTPGGWSGAARLEARVGSSGNAISGYGTGGGTALLARTDVTSGRLADFWYQTTGVGSITTTGSATQYNTTSDTRLKQVCARQRDYRDAIRDLWVGDFTWKDSGAPGFGVLAQQAHDVMPCRAGVTRPDSEDGLWQASSEPFAFLALWGVKDLYAANGLQEIHIRALQEKVAKLEEFLGVAQ